MKLVFVAVLAAMLFPAVAKAQFATDGGECDLCSAVYEQAMGICSLDTIVSPGAAGICAAYATLLYIQCLDRYCPNSFLPNGFTVFGDEITIGEGEDTDDEPLQP